MPLELFKSRAQERLRLVGLLRGSALLRIQLQGLSNFGDAIERLRDHSFRRRLGDAARATVVERYSLDAAVPRMVEALEPA